MKSTLKVALVILAVFGILALGACAPFSSNSPKIQELTPCEANNALMKAQAEADAERLKAQAETQRRCTTLELAVIKACVDHGNIPVWINGNVDCKLAPPKAK